MFLQICEMKSERDTAARLSSINSSLARMQSQAGPASANQVTYQQLHGQAANLMNLALE